MNKFKTIRAFAPATVANVVCGYDVLGFALSSPGDEVRVSTTDSGIVSLRGIHGDQGLLPLDPDKNVATAVIKYYLQQIGSSQGVEVELFKNMPLNSGMGSSSASTVAALVAINALMGEPLTRIELLPLAMEGERLACGNAHADNVAPALLGGLTLVRSTDPIDAIKLPVPDGLSVALVHPDIEVPTRESRRIIKDRVAVRDAVKQWANVGGLVAGFCTSDFDLIGRSMEDVIFEPVRAMLIPAFYDMKHCALELGALGMGISGSGPSVFALTRSQTVSEHIVLALQKILYNYQIHSQGFVTKINFDGARLINN